MKPMLASDAVIEKLRYPLIAQPKIDGVRALNIDGTLTGRSLKKHANKHVTNLFSCPALVGFDGEMAAQSDTHPDLCRLTSSALSSIEGQPFIVWWLFDYLAEPELPYHKRLEKLVKRLWEISTEYPSIIQHLRAVPSFFCKNPEQLLQLEAQWLDAGYEGLIVRDPDGLHKQGRSTVREGGLLRIKRFVDAEAVVIGIAEGQTNTNSAQSNELGLQFRSTHQDGMVPNGQVGSLLCRVLKRVTDRDKVLMDEGQEITVAPGRMSEAQRKHYFAHQNELLGKVIKFQFFPKGIKDKPRFPTFQTFRSDADLGGE